MRLRPAALKRLIAAGARLRPFPRDAMEAAYKASESLLDEISADNATFKKLRDSMWAFREDQYLWWRVAEANFDLFMMREKK